MNLPAKNVLVLQNVMFLLAHCYVNSSNFRVALAFYHGMRDAKRQSHARHQKRCHALHRINARFKWGQTHVPASAKESYWPGNKD